MGVVDAATQLQSDAFAGELIRDVPGVRQWAGESIELGHNEGVLVLAGGEGLAKAGPFALGAGESVIDVDSVGTHTGGRESVALGG